MKKIYLPKEVFELNSKMSVNLITNLLNLKKAGFEIFTPTSLDKTLLKLLYNEGLQITTSERIPDNSYFVNYKLSKKELQLNSKNFSTLSDLIDSLTLQTRQAEKIRETKETKIFVKLNLDGIGKCSIQSGIGFFDHMLEQIGRHSNIDLMIKAKGDLRVDEHHTVEDIGITLGETLSNALGTKHGIQRYGFFIPMDDSVAVCSIDLGGRPYLNFNCKFAREKVGDFPTELVKEFFRGITLGLRANIFIKAKGENDHHKIESMFKSFAKALNEACRLDDRNHGVIPTTKGII